MDSPSPLAIPAPPPSPPSPPAFRASKHKVCTWSLRPSWCSSLRPSEGRYIRQIMSVVPTDAFKQRRSRYQPRLGAIVYRVLHRASVNVLAPKACRTVFPVFIQRVELNMKLFQPVGK